MSQPRLIFDAHLDMAWNALDWNRNLELPLAGIRQFESQFDGIIPGENTVSWYEMKRSRIGMSICTLLPRLHRKHRPLSHFQSPEAAYATCVGQMTYYRALAKRGYLREIRNLVDLEDHVGNWLSSTDGVLPIGYIVSMEGATGFLQPEQAGEWYDAGLRLVGPAHYGPNRYCHGTASEGGLSADGRRLIEEMDRVGLILDVTHLADQSMAEALDLYGGPVIASHHNCRALVPADRQLTDDQIRQLVKRDTVIGAAFDNWMIKPGWVIGQSDPSTIKMADIIGHINHICQLAGSSKHCGIGTDLDGGYGKEQSPSDLDTIADLTRFAELLSERGYSDDDVEGIMYRNYIDFFRRARS